MCGGWGAARCTPERWYKFMGDVSETFVPFQMNYKLHENTEKTGNFTPLDPKIIPCNSTVDVS